MSQFLSNVVNRVQAAAEPNPCVSCATKDGLRRYNCAMCERDGFCFQCSNYCVVERSEQVVKTNKEKMDEAKESGKALMQSTWAKLKLAKEAAQKKYRERQQKKENGDQGLSGSAEGAAVEDEATVSGGGLQDDDTAGHPVVRGGDGNDHDHDDNRPTIPCYRLAAVCRECFRHSIQDKIDLSTAFEIVDITVAEKEDGPLTADELSLTNDDAAVILGLHAACNSRKQLRGLAKAIVRGSPKTWVVLIDLPGHGSRMDEQPVDRQANLEAISVALEKVIVPLEGALATNSGADKESLAIAVRNAVQAIDIPEPRANRFAFKHRPRSASVAAQDASANPPAPNNSFANNSFINSNLAVPSRSVASSGQIRRLLLGSGYGSYMGMEFLGAHPEQFDAAIMLNCGYAVGMEDASGLSNAALIFAQEASKIVGSKSLVQAFINDLNKKAIRDTIDFDDAHANLIDCGTYYHTSDDQVGALRTVATRRSMYNYAGPVLFLDGIYDNSKNIVHDVTNVAVENEIDRNKRLKRGSNEAAESNGEEDEEEGAGRQILSRAIHYPKGTRFFIHDTRFQNEVSSDVRLFLTQLHQQPFAAFESLRTPAKVVAIHTAARNPTHASAAKRSDSSQVNFAATPKESLSGTPTPPTETHVPTAVPETAPVAVAAPVAAEPVAAETIKEEVVEDELAQAENVAEEETTAAAVVEEAVPVAAEQDAAEVGDSPAEENDGEADAPKKKKGKGKKGGRK